jgi:soluble lytic murein transglycosylase-like protein
MRNFVGITTVLIGVVGFAATTQVLAAPHAQKSRAAASLSKTTGQSSQQKASSAFRLEAAMSPAKRISRWKTDIDYAAKRIDIPSEWIRAVLAAESGGRTLSAENTPITSPMGAMGLMQLMPQTWREMQQIYNLGNDPYDPHDNILAGAAYLRALYWEYGYPGMFAAYNDGPGMLEAHRKADEPLPAETAQYVIHIAMILRGFPLSQKSEPRTLNALFGISPSARPQPAAPEAEVPSFPAYPKDNDDDYYSED